MISWQDATAAGLKRYYTNKSCKRGHVGERWVANKTCCACLKTIEYKKQFNLQRNNRRANDPDYKKRHALEMTRFLATNPEYKRRRSVRDKVVLAAKTLTEMLGIPHTVVESVDAAGNKTFQPVPVTKEVPT